MHITRVLNIEKKVFSMYVSTVPRIVVQID